jgi:hypothetical protein
MGTPAWQLLARLDHLHELHAQWVSRGLGRGQLKQLFFEEDGQAGTASTRFTPPLQLSERSGGEAKSSELNHLSEVG